MIAAIVAAVAMACAPAAEAPPPTVGNLEAVRDGGTAACWCGGGIMRKASVSSARNAVGTRTAERWKGRPIRRWSEAEGIDG